jgi:hypothetical protein
MYGFHDGRPDVQFSTQLSSCYFNRRDVNTLGWFTTVCDILNERGEGLEPEEKISGLQMLETNNLDTSHT